MVQVRDHIVMRDLRVVLLTCIHGWRAVTKVVEMIEVEPWNLLK